MRRAVVLRRLGGAALAAAAGFALRWTTAFGIGTTQGEDASIRLSWSARPERIEQCRRLSDEELAQRPAHMRLRFECTGGFARYRLVVTLDSQTVRDGPVRGGGLRNDRPMHLFEEFRIPSGTRRIVVALTRADSSSQPDQSGDSTSLASDTLLGGRESREMDERRRRAGEAIPPSLVLDTLVSLAPRQVLLVTYDGQARRFVARSESPTR